MPNSKQTKETNEKKRPLQTPVPDPLREELHVISIREHKTLEQVVVELLALGVAQKQQAGAGR
jgi:hypothetical protein